MKAVFHMPRRSSRCGSHVHVSPSGGSFDLRELKAIAFAVVWYDEVIQNCLHRSRRDCDYCISNVTHSDTLQQKPFSEIASRINNLSNKASVVELIQGWDKTDRKTLWNFHNVTSRPGSLRPATGSVEFRGGRCLRGPVRTKRWIAFTIAFVALAIEEVCTKILNNPIARLMMCSFHFLSWLLAYEWAPSNFGKTSRLSQLGKASSSIYQRDIRQWTTHRGEFCAFVCT